MAFQIESLPLDLPIPSDAVRAIATHKPGFPCRISLADAEIGEEVLLFHYEHHAANSPFRSSHAIYIRPNATQACLAPNQLPAFFLPRILSLRAFDNQGMMLEADLAEGETIAPTINRLLANSRAAYVHIHFAKPGCYAACAIRAK